MYLSEALLHSSKLLDEVAAVYLLLAALPAATPEVTSMRQESARKEAGLAKLFFALSELYAAVDDRGPFLAGLPARLSGLRFVLEKEVRRLSSGLDPNADRKCLEALHAAGLESLHADLLEAAEPEMTRVLRLMDAEISHSRRALHEVGESEPFTPSNPSSPPAPPLHAGSGAHPKPA